LFNRWQRRRRVVVLVAAEVEAGWLLVAAQAEAGWLLVAAEAAWWWWRRWGDLDERIFLFCRKRLLCVNFVARRCFNSFPNAVHRF
jgi:hypothetical protein